MRFLNCNANWVPVLTTHAKRSLLNGGVTQLFGLLITEKKESLIRQEPVLFMRVVCRKKRSVATLRFLWRVKRVKQCVVSARPFKHAETKSRSTREVFAFLYEVLEKGLFLCTFLCFVTGAKIVGQWLGNRKHFFFDWKTILGRLWFQSVSFLSFCSVK